MWEQWGLATSPPKQNVIFNTNTVNFVVTNASASHDFPTILTLFLFTLLLVSASYDISDRLTKSTEYIPVTPIVTVALHKPEHGIQWLDSNSLITDEHGTNNQLRNVANVKMIQRAASLVEFGRKLPGVTANHKHIGSELV